MERIFRMMPRHSKECVSCCGTGEGSPWEHNHYLWLNGQPFAVCGACRGAGYLTKWGFRLNAETHYHNLKRSAKILLEPLT